MSDTDAPKPIFAVVTASGKIVCETEDLFVGLATVKKQPPGSKLVRIKDRKVLAFTTGFKSEYRPYQDD